MDTIILCFSLVETEKFEFCQRGVDSEESEHQEKVGHTPLFTFRVLQQCSPPETK